MSRVCLRMQQLEVLTRYREECISVYWHKTSASIFHVPGMEHESTEIRESSLHM